ncbi:MAG: signal peptidase I, partial [Xanthomonadales bacterium]|nr:signal peptidase I [Xanthomonadales bacterium]
PIYNLHCLIQVASRPEWWLILLFIPLVNMVVGVIVALDVARNFGKSVAFGIGLVILPIIFYPILGFGSAQYGGAPG